MPVHPPSLVNEVEVATTKETKEEMAEMVEMEMMEEVEDTQDQDLIVPLSLLVLSLLPLPFNVINPTTIEAIPILSTMRVQVAQNLNVTVDLNQKQNQTLNTPLLLLVSRFLCPTLFDQLVPSLLIPTTHISIKKVLVS